MHLCWCAAAAVQSAAGNSVMTSCSIDKEDSVEVRIKKLDINMLVKQNGIEFEVRTPDGASQTGDCYLTMTGLVWCKGKTTKAKGTKISWDELAVVLGSDAAKKAALKAARAV
jgi:hypothetical protein